MAQIVLAVFCQFSEGFLREVFFLHFFKNILEIGKVDDCGSDLKCHLCSSDGSRKREGL